MDIISDMRLTVSSLDSKEALTNIDKVYMDYVTSNLHASMCEKNKLRVYRELKEASNSSVERRVVNGRNAMAKCPRVFIYIYIYIYIYI